MSSYTSILSCLSSSQNEVSQSSDTNSDELNEADTKEVSDIVEDLLTIQNKDVLKRNLTSLVSENVSLKKLLEKMLSESKQSSGSMFQIDCDGADDAGEGVEVSDDTGPVLGLVKDDLITAPAKTGGNSCFNCGDQHMLADCKLPRDQKKIAKALKEFKASNMSLNSSRYHEDEPQKFGHLRPGLPSEKLRAALGLVREECPQYIYLMRELGYPPGWLRHAQIRSSGMSVYHGEKEVTGGEDGEVVENSDDPKVDIDKLVEWPGFNSELPREFRDDTSRLRVRRRSKTESLRQMKEKLKHKQQTGYIRAEMMDVSTEKKNDDNDSVVVEDETAPPGEDNDDSVVVIEDDTAPPGDDNDKTEAPAGDDMSEVRQESHDTSNTGVVTQTDPGTPILEMYSPFSQLPQYNNFGKNMTEHIAFENLPNATGNWDKMRGVLKGVRDKNSK